MRGATTHKRPDHRDALGPAGPDASRRVGHRGEPDLVIVALIPLALRGVRYRPTSASSLLRRNLWIYGVGGLIIPFVGIKAIDLIIQFIPGFR